MTGPQTQILQAAACRLEDFERIVAKATDPDRYPSANEIREGVVVYRADQLQPRLDSDRASVMAELADALLEGPGIVVLQGAVAAEAVDEASVVFEEIIDEERRGRDEGNGAGDHFAPPGANDRIWNALEKLALRRPEAFCDYYDNEMIHLASEAWLGPGYQITSQVNVVNPGGRAQQPHRDYHLGFMTDEKAERFPAHIHRLSPLLTLQGAVAHCEMPVETGPTLYLPHSQKYEPGYLAWRRPEFVDYFEANRVQLPLAKGDAVFFNPALFHAAGTNRTTSIRRMANLLQVSSPMGRAMERVDRTAMSLALYPCLLQRRAESGTQDGADQDPSRRHQGAARVSAASAARVSAASAARVSAASAARVIASSAEGYAFPADLDVDQPTEGLAPPSQAQLVTEALDQGWSVEQLRERLGPAEDSGR